MPTLTETMIDIADRHTTLYYLGEKPPAGPLPFQTKDAYCALHATLGQGADYTAVATGRNAALLARMKPAYSDNKYWQSYVGLAPAAFPGAAWESLLPIDISLKRRVSCVSDPRFKFRVSPVPRVRLYPFGWSTWLSLRVSGEHNVSDLAALLEWLFTDKALQYEGEATTFAVGKFLTDIADGVRQDSFGGNATKDNFTQNTGVVTTVMSKYGGAHSLGALSPDEERELRRIARPYGPPPGGPFDQHVVKLPPDSNSTLEYLVHDTFGRFLWVEHLLQQDARAHVQLRCYHNNNFASLVHAWHLHALLDAVVYQKHPAGPAFDLAQSAANLLVTPGYKCAGLVQYLAEPAVVASLKAFEKFAAPKPP